MITPLDIPGAFRVDGHAASDARGSFRKPLDALRDAIPSEFRTFDEVAASDNRRAGTLRGMHFQTEPHGQTKVVWVASGAIFDAFVDLRPDSPAYGAWIGIELDVAEPTALLLPAGVAHGFQTLVDDTTVVYQMRGAYKPDLARTLRWDDESIGIDWPIPVQVISEKDAAGESWPVS